MRQAVLTAKRKFERKPFDRDTFRETLGQVYIIEDRCKGCTFCAKYCPREVLQMSTRFNAKGYHPPEVRNPRACVACGFCEMICPDFAIFSKEVR